MMKIKMYERTYHLTQWAQEQELILQEYLSSPLSFCGFCFAQS